MNSISSFTPAAARPQLSPTLRDELSDQLAEMSPDRVHLNIPQALHQLAQVDGLAKDQAKILRHICDTADTQHSHYSPDQAFSQLLAHPDLTPNQVKMVDDVITAAAMRVNADPNQNLADALAHPEATTIQGDLLFHVGSYRDPQAQTRLYQDVLAHPAVNELQAQAVQGVLPLMGDFVGKELSFNQACTRLMEAPLNPAQTDLLDKCLGEINSCEFNARNLHATTNDLKADVVVEALLAHPQVNSAQAKVLACLAEEGKRNNQFDTGKAFSVVAAHTDLGQVKANELLTLFHEARPAPEPSLWQRLTDHLPAHHDYTKPFLAALE